MAVLGGSDIGHSAEHEATVLSPASTCALPHKPGDRGPSLIIPKLSPVGNCAWPPADAPLREGRRPESNGLYRNVTVLFKLRVLPTTALREVLGDGTRTIGVHVECGNGMTRLSLGRSMTPGSGQEPRQPAVIAELENELGMFPMATDLKQNKGHRTSP